MKLKFSKHNEPSPLPVADRSLSKVINQRAILRTIYEHNGISRAQLAKELGISKPTVAGNVEDLMQIGIVKERGEGSAAKNGGRKPVMLYINEKHRYVGAVDLSFLEPVCAISDLKNNVIGLQKIKLKKNASAETRRQSVKGAFLSLIEKNHILPEELGAIVISRPGIIQEGAGVYYTESRHHAWTEIQLDTFLQEEFQTEVSIKNDVNLAAIGEQYYGFKEEIHDMIYVRCGIGLGAGMILNGSLYSGPRSAAGEIGAMRLENGQRLEDFVSVDGFTKRVEAALPPDAYQGEEMDFATVVDLFEKGNPVIQEMVREIGRYLGIFLYNCCILLDVDTVVFGGDYLVFDDVLFHAIESEMKDRAHFKPTLMKSQINQIAGIFGCFVFGVEKIMNSLVG